MSAALARHLRISGRVQGVGFREAMCAEARRLGVTGWVRNRRDGSVEAVVQGDAAALDALIAWAGQGPPAARVTDVLAGPVPDGLEPRHEPFDWLPTV